MLEFYQAYANYHDLMDLTEELVKFVAMEVNGTTKTTFNDVEIDLEKWSGCRCAKPSSSFGAGTWNDAQLPMKRQTSCSFLKQTANMQNQGLQFGSNASISSPLYCSELWVTIEEDRTVLLEFYSQRLSLQYDVESGKSIATVFEYLAEPHLIQPTIIYDFPLAVSPLSKVKPASRTGWSASSSTSAASRSATPSPSSTTPTTSAPAFGPDRRAQARRRRSHGRGR